MRVCVVTGGLLYKRLLQSFRPQVMDKGHLAHIYKLHLGKTQEESNLRNHILSTESTEKQHTGYLHNGYLDID